MAIFAVTAPISNDKIGPALEHSFPGQFIRAWQGHWFVSSAGTSKEIYEKIEANTPEAKTGTVTIIPVANYYGYASNEVWEWLKSRLEKK